ncbi:hypothetical protein [Asaia spathodeae]|uniref:Uncharacterized protein n=1 Tax=Asaia spathodeae TaxID=657016 RepID=A0ABX2P8M5_9PROT|nr:hypothetical protein [Asaia spathodeae]
MSEPPSEKQAMHLKRLSKRFLISAGISFILSPLVFSYSEKTILAILLPLAPIVLTMLSIASFLAIEDAKSRYTEVKNYPFYNSITCIFYKVSGFIPKPYNYLYIQYLNLLGLMVFPISMVIFFSITSAICGEVLKHFGICAPLFFFDTTPRTPRLLSDIFVGMTYCITPLVIVFLIGYVLWMNKKLREL